MNRGPVKKLRYTLFESHLQKSIRSLEAWHAIFDPSWFLLTLHKDGTIDDALRNHSATGPHIDTVLAIRTAIQTSQTQAENSGSVFRDGIVSPEQEMLPHSSLAISKLLGNGAQVILDTTTYPEALDRALITTHVRDLARLLSCSRPWTLGLLQCVGVLKKLDSSGKISQFQFIFATPPGPDTTPTSLRILLLQGSISLDTKLVIAKSITRAVLAVHSANFIHKNIRPDTILVFGGSTDQDATAYLVGFERSRPAEANTSLIGDMIWERNLYRHPSRQGIRLEEIYKMQHDIYSLGVCLLEIGIWQSLIVPCNPAVPGKVLHIDEQLRMKNPLQAAWEIKSILCGMAKTLLPSLMGLLYTDIVISCLTCLDPEATNMFANEKDLYDEDGILVGVVFIEKILTRIESLSISPPQSLLASGSGAQGLYP